jgi:hypothetical protein
VGAVLPGVTVLWIRARLVEAPAFAEASALINLDRCCCQIILLACQVAVGAEELRRLWVLLKSPEGPSDLRGGARSKSARSTPRAHD